MGYCYFVYRVLTYLDQFSFGLLLFPPFLFTNALPFYFCFPKLPCAIHSPLSICVQSPYHSNTIMITNPNNICTDADSKFRNINFLFEINGLFQKCSWGKMKNHGSPFFTLQKLFPNQANEDKQEIYKVTSINLNQKKKLR